MHLSRFTHEITDFQRQQGFGFEFTKDTHERLWAGTSVRLGKETPHEIANKLRLLAADLEALGLHTSVPTYATPPGDTLRETLKAKGISQKLLAETMGRPMKTISEIIHDKARITAHTALELEHALGIPAQMWMALETNYRLAIARKNKV